MAKMIGYREFIEYIVLNDDISEVTESDDIGPSQTILMSAAGHLFNKEPEEVQKDLIAKIKKFKKEGIL